MQAGPFFTVSYCRFLRKVTNVYFEFLSRPKINIPQSDMSEQTEFSSGNLMKAGERARSHRDAYGRFVAVMRVVCAVAFGLAISTAIIIVLLDLIWCLQPRLVSWTLKSADPLILIGIAFASLQFALPRTRTQRLLGFMVAAAFILWGAEQFLPSKALVSFIDDVVVLLFVTDISIVIYGHLKPGAHLTGKELPFDESGE